MSFPGDGDLKLKIQRKNSQLEHTGKKGNFKDFQMK